MLTATRRTQSAAIGIAALLLSGCQQQDGPAAALGTMERDRIELTAESNEPILRIVVGEGDIVATGDVLLVQDNSRASVALTRAQADEAVARSALSEAEKGPRQQQISQARSRLQAADSAVRTARIELDRQLELVARELVARSAADVARGNYQEAAARQAEARAALDELMEGTRSEAIDQARARHAAAVANVENLRITLARSEIAAPVNGVVEALPFEIGERPSPGAIVAVMLASGPTYARIHVSEPLRAQLSTGAPAEIRLDGRDAPLAGKLRWIAARAAFTPYFALNQHDRSRLSYVAEVDVVDAPRDLPVGVPVEVTFPGLRND